MNTIIVSNFISNGLSEKNGLILREKISEFLEKDQEVILDFSNITLFATPFFNSFIGYFVLKMNPDIVKEKIKIVNISELGQDTYKHSYENATFFYNKKINTEKIGKITSDNISEG